MPQSPSYTNVGRVSDIGRGEMSIDRPARRPCGIPTPARERLLRTRSVSGGMQNVSLGSKPKCQPRRNRYLRLTKVPSDETDEKLRDPCSARSAEICRRAPIANVFNADGEGSPLRYGSAIAAYPLDVECEIIGSKSEAHDFRRKRELVAAGQQVMAAFAPKKGLSLLAETQVNRLGHRHDLALFLHGSPPLACIRGRCYSNRRATYAFLLSSRTLADRSRMGIRGSVRNTVIDSIRSREGWTVAQEHQT
jgi:hypothetical protein